MMEFFGKQEKEKIVITIESEYPSFIFETHGDAMDLIDKALKHGYIVRIEEKKVTKL